MISNELPTGPGLYWWHTPAEEWLCMVVYHDDELGLCASEMGEACSVDILNESFKPVGQWVRIPCPDKLMEMMRKADQWDALGRSAEQPAADLATRRQCSACKGDVTADDDATCDDCGCLLCVDCVECADADGEWSLCVKCMEDHRSKSTRAHEPADPWITLYREHIRREHVPKWAKWVCVWARGGGVSWASSDPDEYGICTTGRMTTRGGLDAMPPGGLDSLRRVADVWPEGGE